MMRRMILCLACAVLARAAAAAPFVCVVITGFNAVDTCVETKILRRVRAESSRRPPRHRRDASLDFPEIFGDRGLVSGL